MLARLTPIGYWPLTRGGQNKVYIMPVCSVRGLLLFDNVHIKSRSPQISRASLKNGKSLTVGGGNMFVKGGILNYYKCVKEEIDLHTYPNKPYIAFAYNGNGWVY